MYKYTSNRFKTRAEQEVKKAEHMARIGESWGVCAAPSPGGEGLKEAALLGVTWNVCCCHHCGHLEIITATKGDPELPPCSGRTVHCPLTPLPLGRALPQQPLASQLSAPHSSCCPVPCVLLSPFVYHELSVLFSFCSSPVEAVVQKPGVYAVR